MTATNRQSWLRQAGGDRPTRRVVSCLTTTPTATPAGRPSRPPKQDALLSSVATTLLGNSALGCDIIEVGYTLRSGVDLNHHVALWDVLSRNGKFLTGNGTTDDHFGTNWTGIHNNWVTSAWAGSASEPDLPRPCRQGGSGRRRSRASGGPSTSSPTASRRWAR